MRSGCVKWKRAGRWADFSKVFLRNITRTYNATFVDGRPVLPGVELKLLRPFWPLSFPHVAQNCRRRTFQPPWFKHFFERVRLNTVTRSAIPCPKQCVSTVRPCPVSGTRLNILVSTVSPHFLRNKGHIGSVQASLLESTRTCVYPPYLTD